MTSGTRSKSTALIILGLAAVLIAPMLGDDPRGFGDYAAVVGLAVIAFWLFRYATVPLKWTIDYLPFLLVSLFLLLLS